MKKKAEEQKQEIEQLKRSNFEDKKYLANAISEISWNLIASAGAYRVFSVTMVRAMTLIEGVITIFYAIIMLANLNAEEKRKVSSSYFLYKSKTVLQMNVELHLIENNTFGPRLDLSYLAEMINSEKFEDGVHTVSVYINAIILSINLIVIVTLINIAKAAFTEEVVHFNQQKKLVTPFKAAICTIIVVQSRFLYIPILDFSVRTFFVDYENHFNVNRATIIVFQLLNCVSVVFICFLTLFGRRILALNVPSVDFAPWSIACSSKLHYIGTIIRSMPAVFLAIDRGFHETRILTWTILTFITHGILFIGLLFMPSTLEGRDSLIRKFFHGIATLIYEIGLISYILGVRSQGKELLILFSIGFFQCITIYFHLQERNKQQLNKLLKEGPSSFKNAGHAESVLIQMIEATENLINASDVAEIVSSENYNYFFRIFEGHRDRCDQGELCRCYEIGEYVKLLKYGDQRVQGSGNILILQSKLVRKFPIIAEEFIRKRYANKTVSLVNIITANEPQVIDFDPFREDQSNSDPLVVICQQTVCRRLFSMLTCVLCHEFMQYQPQSLKLYLLNCYIYSVLMKRPFLCLNEMRAFDSSELQILDQISKKVNDTYILTRLGFIENSKSKDSEKIPKFESERDIQVELNANSQIKQELDFQKGKGLFGKLDIDHYIEIDSLKGEFINTIESLKEALKEFWHVFDHTSSTSKFHPKIVLQKGKRLAQEIKTVNICFEEIHKLSSKKDPQLYSIYALVQLHLLNSEAAYNELLSQMRSIQEVIKIEQGTVKQHINSMNDFDEESPFMIVSASLLNMGVVIMMNEICATAIGRDRKTCKNMNINEMMPRIIRFEHDRFIKAFSQLGRSSVLNKWRAMMILNREGTLVPAQLLVRMHYSQMYGYCYFGTCKLVTHMSPFNQYEMNMPIDKLCFLTFNTKDGRVYEFSNTFIELLKKYNAIQISKTIDEMKDFINEECRMTLDEIFNDLNIKEKQERHKVDNVNSEFLHPQPFSYQGVHMLNLSYFNANAFSQEDCISGPLVRLSLITELYQLGQVEMGIAIFTLESSMCISMRGKTVVGNSLIHPIDSHPSEDEGMKVNQAHDSTEDMFFNQSEGGQSSAASASVSSELYNENSSLRSLKQGLKVPQSLRIALQLSLFLFLISISIASINLGINIQNKEQGASTVKIVRKYIDRVNFTSNSRLLVRTMINIANGYEPRSSPIIDDRWTFYSRMLSQIIDLSKKTQNTLDDANKISKESYALQKLKDAPLLPLKIINSYNQVTTQNATLSQAQNLFQSKITYINNGDMRSFQGNLSLQSLTPNRSKDYQPNEIEQIIYFAVMNGNGAIRQYNWVLANQQFADTQAASEDFQKLTLITTIISVISILLVLLMISPIISKNEERQYKGLYFFLEIPLEIRREYIKNCLEFRFIKPNSNIIPQISVQSQTIMSLTGSKQPPSSFDLEEEVKECHGSDYNTDDKHQSNFDSLTSLRHLSSKQDKMIEKNPTMRRQITNIYGGQNLLLPKLKKAIAAKHKQLIHKSNRNSCDEFFCKNESKASVAKQDSQQKKVFYQQNSLNIEQDQQPQAQKEEKEEQNEETINQEMHDIIREEALKHKMKRVLSIVLTIVIFGVYFTISYLMAIKNYQVTAQSVMDLNTILFKEACFENMITFIRENQIRNESVVLSEDNKTVASASLIVSCQEKERNYEKLRKTMPVYLSGATQVMMDLESNDFCDIIYEGPLNEDIKSRCKLALNGLLTKGITNAIAYMYRQSQKIQMSFDNAVKFGGRNLQFLKQQLSDPETIEMIDIKLYLFSKAFEELKNASSQSLMSYFETVMFQMVGLFFGFVLFLTICLSTFLLVVYQNMKETTWNTNIILRIIPAQDFKGMAERIKAFLKK